MNHPSLLVTTLGVAILFIACGGKVVVEAPGSSGDGGAGGSTAAAPPSTSDGATNPTNATSTGTAMTCSTQGCYNAITNPIPPGLLCDDVSEKAYTAFKSCVCADKCQSSCAANDCIGMPISPPCKACIEDAVNGCGKELDFCITNSGAGEDAVECRRPQRALLPGLKLRHARRGDHLRGHRVRQRSEAVAD